MQKIYAKKPIPKNITKSIFLAGPSPRDNNVTSWRSEALQILDNLGYDGVVFIPEDEGGFVPFPKNYTYKFDIYNSQFEWERYCLDASDCIVFWIPRTDLLPGFTTNIEFGLYIDRKNISIGSPKTASKNNYLKKECENKNIPWFDTLEDTLKHALDMLGKGNFREGIKAKIPQPILNIKGFESWLEKLIKEKNIKTVRVEKFIKINNVECVFIKDDKNIISIYNHINRDN